MNDTFNREAVEILRRQEKDRKRDELAKKIIVAPFALLALVVFFGILFIGLS